MPEQLKVLSYTIPPGGANKTFPVTEKYELYQLIPDGGSVTLLANVTIGPTGTPTEGLRYTFDYKGDVIAGAFSISIFSKTLSTAEALAKYTITCTYTNGAWDVLLLLSNNNGANPSVSGAEIQAGTIPSASMDSSGVALSEIANASGEGMLIVSNSSNVRVDLDASTTGAFPVGDGNTPVMRTMSGDVTLSSIAVATIANNVISPEKLTFTIENNILSAKLSITSAQVLVLSGTPLEIVPTPGTGKFIEVISAFTRLATYGGTPYATNTILELGNAGASTDQMKDSDALISTVARITKFKEDSPASTSDTQGIENTPLNIAVKTANPTAGNSDIEIYVVYRIVDLI